MRDPDNIRDVALLQPDYMGFIFYPQSPRYVGSEFVLSDTEKSIERVAVSVNQAVEEVARQADDIGASWVQLHGEESPEMCAMLRGRGCKVMKVFSVDDEFDFRKTGPYESSVELFLFDTKGKQPGGNAVPFNWSVLNKYNQRVPFLLSGGLNSSNLNALHELKTMNLHGVDLNSGVEDKPGRKSIEKIKLVKELIERL